MREVTAYAANDGRVYATRAEAAEADARAALKQLDLLKEETINFLVKNVAAIVAAISPLAEYAELER